MADDSTSVEAVRAKDHDYPSYHELSDCIVVQEYKDQVLLTRWLSYQSIL